MTKSVTDYRTMFLEFEAINIGLLASLRRREIKKRSEINQTIIYTVQNIVIRMDKWHVNNIRVGVGSRALCTTDA